jgi:hypothetical protein
MTVLRRQHIAKLGIVVRAVWEGCDGFVESSLRGPEIADPDQNLAQQRVIPRVVRCQSHGLARGRDGLVDPSGTAEQMAQDEMRLGRFGRQVDGGSDLLLGGRQYSRLHQRNPEFNPTESVYRIELHDFAAYLDCFGKSALRRQQIGQPGVMLRIAWSERYQAPQRLFCRPGIACPQAQFGEMGMEVDPAGLQTDRLTCRRNGLIHSPSPAQRVAQIEMKSGGVRRQFDGAEDCRLRGLELACRHQHMAKLRMPMRISRIEFDRGAPRRYRLGMAPGRAQDVSKLTVSMRLARVQFDCPAQRPLRPVEIADPDREISDSGMRRGAFRLELNHFRGSRKGSGDAPRAAEHFA